MRTRYCRQYMCVCAARRDLLEHWQSNTIAYLIKSDLSPRLPPRFPFVVSKQYFRFAPSIHVCSKEVQLLHSEYPSVWAYFNCLSPLVLRIHALTLDTEYSKWSNTKDCPFVNKSRFTRSIKSNFVERRF